MKFKTRLISLLLVLVMLLPMVVACGDPSVENAPTQDKDPVAGELAALPESAEKVDAKALLLELLKEAELDANMATVTVKFKGDFTASFLDPDASYSTSDLVDFVDDEGYILIPVSSIIEMFGSDNAVMGDLTSIYKDILLEFVSNGNYASLEEMLGGVVDSLNIDFITEQYGSVDNYLSVILVAQLVGAVITANEYAAHMEAGMMDAFANCADQIQYNVEELTSFMLEEVRGGNDLVDVIDFIYTEDYLGLLASGSVCGISVDETKDSIYEVNSALSDILNDIEIYDAIYDGEGNYNLEVYYPAIANNIDAILYAFIYNYGYNEIVLDYEYVREALVEHLGTEDGPVANLDICDILLSVGATALAIIYSNDMIIESGLDYEDPTVAFYNLADEKWYVNGEDEPVAEEVTVLGVYGGEGENYTSEISEYPYTTGYDDVYGETIYTVYYVTVGDEVYVSFDETANAVFDEMFELFIGGVGAEMTDADKTMVAATMLAFTMTYPEQDGEKLMDAAFAESFIISALSASVLDGAYETFTEIAVKLGYEKAPETPDTNAFYAEDFVEYWLNTVEIPEGENLEVEDYIVCLIIMALDTANDSLNDYYVDYFSEILSTYLAAKYLDIAEAGEAFEGEELDDGLPMAVAAALLGEWVRLNSDNYSCDYVKNFVVEYYDGDLGKIVNYEDILAIFTAIKNGELDGMEDYRYPFDYVEHMAIFALLDAVMSEKFADSNADYDLARAVVARLLGKIYLIGGDVGYNTSDVLVDFIWVVLATDLSDTKLSGMMYMFKSAVNFAMTEDEIELTTCSVDVALEYILGMLYTEVPEDSDRYIDYLLANLLPTQTEDARTALAESMLVVISEAYEDFEGIKGLDNEVIVYLLSNISVLLSENGMDTTVLNSVVDAIEAFATDLDMEALLDIIISESFANEDYTVLTDVVLALMGGTTQDILSAIAAAKTALADDLIAVGYLRALEAQINASKPTMDGILNAVALMYLAEYHAEDVSAVIVPALHMTYDEFKAYFKFENHYPDVYAVRDWASKYITLYTENGTVNALEMAVDFLIASNYYDENEIPDATDKLYYEKLGAIYAANEYFCNYEYADAFVDVIFNPENIYLYGETFLEIAEGVQVTDRASSIAKIVFYVMSTKGYLALEDGTNVDWERVLAYIPELYESYMGEELEIANYAAFAEILRPAFADDVNAAFEATVVPYKTETEIIYVFTVYGDIQHVAVEGDCEIVIEIRVPYTE